VVVLALFVLAYRALGSTPRLWLETSDRVQIFVLLSRRVDYDGPEFGRLAAMLVFNLGAKPIGYLEEYGNWEAAEREFNRRLREASSQLGFPEVLVVGWARKPVRP
jgi:hypothetical protein